MVHGANPFPLFTQANGINHILLCSVTSGLGDRQKGRSPRWSCILFFCPERRGATVVVYTLFFPVDVAKNPPANLVRRNPSKIRNPQMWERAGIWGHREEAQRPVHKTMRLAEAQLERHAPGGSMPSEAPKHCKIQSRRDAPKMAILEAPCAQNAPGRSTMRPTEALLPRNPTRESPHFSGLTIRVL